MIKGFEKLTNDERDLLLQAPALVSLLAVSGDHDITKAEKADAVNMAHLRTFTADPVLIPYYQEVDKTFRSHFVAGVARYTPFDDGKRKALKKEIEQLNQVMTKLDKGFRVALHQSLTSYGDHVKKSNRSFLEGFIFPFPIPGLTD